MLHLSRSQPEAMLQESRILPDGRMSNKFGSGRAHYPAAGAGPRILISGQGEQARTRLT